MYTLRAAHRLRLTLRQCRLFSGLSSLELWDCVRSRPLGLTQYSNNALAPRFHPAKIQRMFHSAQSQEQDLFDTNLDIDNISLKSEFRTMSLEDLLNEVADGRQVSDLAEIFFWVSRQEVDPSKLWQDPRFQELLCFLTKYSEFARPLHLKMSLDALACIYVRSQRDLRRTATLANVLAQQWAVAVQKDNTAPIDHARGDNTAPIDHERVLQSMVALEVYPAALFPIVAKMIKEGSFEARSYADVLAWLVRAPPQYLDRAALDRLLLLIEASSSSFQSYEILSILRSLKLLSRQTALPPSLLQHIYADLELIIDQVKPVHLVSILRYMLSCGGYQPQLLETISSKVVLYSSNHPELFEEVIKALDSLSYANPPPGKEIINALFANVKRAIPALSMDQLALVLRAAARLSYDDTELVKELCSAIQSMPAGTARPYYLVNGLFALASIGYQDEATINCLVKEISRLKPRDLNDKALCELVISLAHFQVPSDSIFGLISTGLVSVPTQHLHAMKNELQQLGFMDSGGSLIPYDKSH
eukprot:gb/GEZN01004823.1/.p1 GENE.gb/GEZN01004823.1/~~gb/GEZN01004823.1/.p1  ORF type:complete len:533 (+),score=50.34 gb/GEZN01004823.1/:208-1806(+)